MLDHAGCLPNPPLLIVTSRLADERLWAEALNLGAYDVLAKPFDKREVIRTVTAAWLHWANRSSAWAQQGTRATATA
jgi:DNA-binding response OmpR family regulator